MRARQLFYSVLTGHWRCQGGCHGRDGRRLLPAIRGRARRGHRAAGGRGDHTDGGCRGGGCTVAFVHAHHSTL